jgi:hypothetical protein
MIDVILGGMVVVMVVYKCKVVALNVLLFSKTVSVSLGSIL